MSQQTNCSGVLKVRFFIIFFSPANEKAMECMAQTIWNMVQSILSFFLWH